MTNNNEELQNTVELAVRQHTDKQIERISSAIKYSAVALVISVAFVSWTVKTYFDLLRDDFNKQLNGEFIDRLIDKQTSAEIKQKVMSQVSAEVSEALLKAQIDQKVEDILQKGLNSFKDSKIDGLIKVTEEKINTKVDETLKNVKASTLQDQLNRIAFPKGAILAFNRKECPKGWNRYTEADGRFLKGTSFTESKIGIKRGFFTDKVKYLEYNDMDDNLIEAQKLNFVDKESGRTIARNTIIFTDDFVNNFQKNLPYIVHPYLVVNYCIKQ